MSRWQLQKYNQKIWLYKNNKYICNSINLNLLNYGTIQT